MKVAVIQMTCTIGDKNANFEKAAPMIEEACQNGAKLIVLPELFNTGYCCRDDWALAETGNDKTYEFLKYYTVKYDTSIMAGFIKRSNVPGLVYNSVMYVHKNEKAKIYRKMYLWGAEKNRFIRGEELSVWKNDGINTAAQICYEVGFSENARMLTFGGAEIICYSAAFGRARGYAWDLATRARALENGCFVLASNHSSDEEGLEFCGMSRIVNTKGEVIAEATKDNEVVMADIDINDIYKQRDEIPYLRDIRTSYLGKEYSNIEK